MIRKLRNYQKKKLSRLCTEACLRAVEVGQFFHSVPSPRGGIQSLCRKYTMPQDQKGTRKKYGSKAMYDSAQFRTKVCNKHERYSEVQVQSLFKDQTESWTRNVNDADIFQRSDADPRGRESFRETTCKSKTNTGTFINKWLGLYSYGTETMDWHWNTGVQGSSLFSSVKIH